MAEKQQVEEETNNGEKKIPVFTVLKNNAVLKNIFVLDTPRPQQILDAKEIGQEYEETLLIGRHPDCSIVLEHPSISRFHLRIHSKPSSLSLSVTDLSSVHGTWIAGKKIEPNVRVELKEGDTLRLGASSRIYRLHWISVSHAYDQEYPFEPVGEKEMEIHQTQTQDDTEGLEFLFSDMNDLFSPKELYSSAPSLSDNVSSAFHGSVELETHPSLGNGPEQNEESGMDVISSQEELYPSASPVPGNESSAFNGSSEEVEFHSLSEKGLEQNEASELMPDDNMLSAAEQLQTGPSMDNLESPSVRSGQKSASSIWSRRGKSASVRIATGRAREKSISVNVDSVFKSKNCDDAAIKSVSKNLFPRAYRDAEEIFTPDKENITPNTHLLSSLKRTRRTGHGNRMMASVSKSPASFVVGEDEIFTPDKENITPKTSRVKSMKNMRKLEGIMDETSCLSSPLKNVITASLHPESHELSSVNNKILVPEMIQGPMNLNPTSSSGVTLVLHEKDSKCKEDRIPFQSLLNEPTSQSKTPDPNDSKGCRKSINHPQTKPICNNVTRVENSRWTIVADTTSLLSKESRKALQLLQGLKRTNLIVPRIVVRELDSIKRRGSFFKRTNEASAALQWIDDCMENAKWWIHVQSSAEEVRPIAVTPPATPLSCFTEDNGTMISPSGTFLEIISPTAEDHILECALFFRTFLNGQLVLLSNDVSLKIKAMAEGLICETPEQFRESLVNPFSDRFLWTDSSPRGPTWSCMDDVVLRERYYHGPCKNPSKSSEAVKGLKLILLHNSNYRQREPPSAANQ